MGCYRSPLWWRQGGAGPRSRARRRGTDGSTSAICRTPQLAGRSLLDRTGPRDHARRHCLLGGTQPLYPRRRRASGGPEPIYGSRGVCRNCGCHFPGQRDPLSRGGLGFGAGRRQRRRASRRIAGRRRRGGHGLGRRREAGREVRSQDRGRGGQARRGLHDAV